MKPEKKIVMLAADTARTSAYAQALADAGIAISSAALVVPDSQRWGQTSSPPTPSASLEDLFLPDVAVPALDACRVICERVDVLQTNSINDPVCIQWLTQEVADLVIFSGFGGELVKSEVLGAGAPLLHMHAGWLPDYRGSTTVYYSLLKEGTIGVSAITLTEEIDSGPIVARKMFPPPPPGVDLDYCYDSAVRADLLVEVIDRYLEKGELDQLEIEHGSQGCDYYIIHPLLKHIVLGRLP
jgi:methionyl-tRNA formyltransferase